MIYLAGISIVAVILTLHDKHAAKRGKWRIKENTLLFVSLLGGSIAMLITMHLIRHKTKHVKFMVGIPVIIVLQVAAGLYIWWRCFYAIAH
ncbi:MAG: DUF1294 domain-containing protein [Clostridiales bacterium]|nr:DUF1294 domain-containing protein [Clostridiales bacterium]